MLVIFGSANNPEQEEVGLTLGGLSISHITYSHTTLSSARKMHKLLPPAV